MSKAALKRYFDAFNRGDPAGMLAELTEDVAHHVNEGGVREGHAAFADFLDRMGRCYSETLSDIVILVSDDGTRGAAEYLVEGTYQQTDEGLPPARMQAYALPGGSFFTFREGRISRVTTYYNLAEWLRQVR
jgi:steroid delta-isomerase-like uncharacterized protein